MVGDRSKVKEFVRLEERWSPTNVYGKGEGTYVDEGEKGINYEPIESLESSLK